ncbi:hypothetical protein AV540_20900 [Brevibacillus parabrevis]|nr:hypothetical protein AV540_20900 [Brevibacillus parabrevis]
MNRMAGQIDEKGALVSMNEHKPNQVDETAQAASEFPVMGTSLNPFDEAWGTFVPDQNESSVATE